jgi:hypothetical protein
MSQYIRIFLNSICRFLNFLELDDKLTEWYALCRTDKFKLDQVSIKSQHFRKMLHCEDILAVLLIERTAVNGSNFN